MKKINSILTMALIALVMGIASCSKSSPVVEYANEIDKATKVIASATDLKDLESKSLEADQDKTNQIITDNADYVLTDSDKDILKEALGNLIKTSLIKGMEFSGQKVSDEEVESYVKMVVDPNIDKATTLGDLLPNNTVIEEEQIIEEITPDSVAVNSASALVDTIAAK